MQNVTIHMTKSSTPTKQSWFVNLGGKKVGKIIQVSKGYQYFPKGSKIGGEIFPTLTTCKKSLDSTD